MTTFGTAVDRALLEAVKLEALARGVRVPTDVVAALGGHDALTVHEYATTGGLTLQLPGDVLVNAPFDEPFCAGSALELRDHDALHLILGADAVPVLCVLPLPGYLDGRTTSGAPASGPAMSHADRIRLSPIAGCAYDCRFCDVASLGYRETPISYVLEALDVALEDTALPPEHLLISGGSAPARNARAQAYFLDVCLAVLEHCRRRRPDGSFTVDVMMSARPDGPEFVDRLADAGVDGFSFNIEVFSDRWAHERLPLKHKWSREHLEPMIRRAVERLGRDRARVRSLIIPGLEPPDDTLAGVAWLASLGCSPVLSPFRPARGTALATAPPVAPELLRRVLDRTREIVAHHGVLLGPRCVACQHNTLSFPWDVEQVAE